MNSEIAGATVLRYRSLLQNLFQIVLSAQTVTDIRIFKVFVFLFVH